ncbi:MAG TPA: LPS-assembly protein LptD [Desulfuromonadales bacterium]|nr:LPS-assembly protein LptD [Desulfuromonadales bacterium]
MKLSTCLAFLILVLHAAGLAFAADTPFSDDTIHINADSMQHGESDVFSASGNVVVTWQGMRLVADRAEYHTVRHTLQASGNVVLSKGNDVLKGETLVLNMESGHAEMDKASLSSPDSSLNVSGDKIVRLNEHEFEVSSTELTTCELPDPSWKFGADELSVNIMGYATGRNVVFYVKNVPVLYLPWIAFPVVREKRSGLLFPRVGYSKSRGAQLDLPLYWVISPSQDLQFDLDMLSRRGVGTALDYRYIRQRGSEGHLGGYQIYDLVENRWRWQLTQSHKEIISPDMNLRMDVNRTGDRTFLGDYGEKSGDYNRQTSDSTVNALKAWQQYALSMYLRYSDNLYATDNQSTVQTLPSISVAGVRQRLPRVPLFFDVDADLANFYRESGTSGQRLNMFPRLTLLPSLPTYLQASLYAGAHLRGYTTDARGTTLHSSDGDLLPEIGTRVSTSLTRVYELHEGSLKKLRHEIIPEISYRYIPERNQERLPFYDYADRNVWQNIVTFSVTSLLNGRSSTGDTMQYRDLSRTKLMLGYSFEGGRRDLLTLVDAGRHWTDLILENDVWLNRTVRATFETRYNLYDHLISTLALGVEADDRQGNVVAAGYRMARNELEYLEARLATKIIKPLNLSYTARYSFDRGDFLESVYAAEYRHQCWSVTTALHQRPGNFSFTVSFNLAGLTGM